MNRSIKTFFLWLLIAVLPLQGMAAAVKTSCGTEHHSASNTIVQIKHATMQTHDAKMHHRHEQMAAHDMHADTVTMQDLFSGSPQPVKHKVKNAACSSCASCCIGAIALLSVATFSSGHDDGAFIVTAPAPLTASFIPSGLERPPKVLSA